MRIIFMICLLKDDIFISAKLCQIYLTNYFNDGFFEDESETENPPKMIAHNLHYGCIL